MKKTILFIFIFISLSLHAQIERIDPPNWWVGMKTNQITLLVYGKAIQDLEPTINYSGVKVVKTEKVENPNYLFVTIDIDSNTIPGNAKIEFKKNGRIKITKNFPILNREKNSANRIGFSTKDAILLIVPDRFANGNPKNDNTPKCLEKSNRNYESGRHGGDIKGIINHLDYIHSLGYTQIWNTPLVENNMPNYSYHGYAATDFYKIDERFGTNEEFKTLVSEAKKRNIGLIWDVVLNHCGSEYYFIKDVPTKDWMNFQDSKKRTNHLKSTLLDPYATVQDREMYTDGWFDVHMPDLNQKNPLVASYLTQNTLWWIEYANLSGFREDTFSYADKDFLANWTKTIMDEYPNFNIVGEEMTNVTELSAYWQKDKINADGYKCFLPTLMDFSLTDNLVKSLSTNNDWESTWKEFYKGMGQDYHYPNPNNLLIFPDNHDMDRFYSRVKNDFESWKLGMTLYTTMRGIPQFYYGTELLFTNEKAGNDGQRRADLYGGWEGDTKNAITGKGLDAKELEAQKYLSKLLNWRKTATVIHNGKFIHFAPEKNDVYVYFRYNENQKVMVILNKNKEKVLLDMNTYYKMIPETFTAKDIINNREIRIEKTLEVAPRSALILEIKN
ncbi:glycoside hydrolase family 13 protein [Flavobacterium luteum]|uniref:Glycoside hydrolase family 13 protein n=1 Tax=Flavobacterium luteum TaxID=2026654 RepID=A0A7J5ABB0_9FLAO|nr:glycoside hydrolase family 13 protein [Flavobacterium luteum]KAB1154836.1 glycoside hydrolase family 13 protein [Flavobacterium luteum]